SVAFGSLEGGSALQISWYSRLDSAGTIVHNRLQRVGPRFDTFVFDPPPSALDSNLTVGGTPATRALLRVNLPRHIRDSVQIVRATLELVPAGGGSLAVRGDSSLLFVHPVAADLGAKSPVQTNLPYDSSLVRVGDTATVQIEITNTVRQWQAD